MYMVDELKPSTIAKKLRISVDSVYDTVAKFKKDVKRIHDPPHPPAKPGRKKTRDNPLLLEAIESFVKANGIYDITASKVHLYLTTLSG